ncbi:hypothetical protein Tco_1366882 [Tanacetum coccineum]
MVKLELDEWIKDSGCTRYMTGNKRLFHKYEAYDRGFNGLEDSTLGLEGISSSESLSNARSSYQNFSSRVIAFFPLSILLECSSLVLEGGPCKIGEMICVPVMIGLVSGMIMICSVVFAMIGLVLEIVIGSV